MILIFLIWTKMFTVSMKMNSKYIVMDLINALPGNSSVNTVQQQTIDEAVFSM
jgi:hypothetical protein